MGSPVEICIPTLAVLPAAEFLFSITIVHHPSSFRWEGAAPDQS